MLIDRLIREGYRVYDIGFASSYYKCRRMLAKKYGLEVLIISEHIIAVK